MAAFHLIIYGRFWVITEDSFRLSGHNGSGNRLLRIQVRMHSGRPVESIGEAQRVQANSDRRPPSQVAPQSPRELF